MQRARAFLLAMSAASLIACGEDPQALPAVSHIVVTPTDVLMAPADTVRFEAVAMGLEANRELAEKSIAGKTVTKEPFVLSRS